MKFLLLFAVLTCCKMKEPTFVAERISQSSTIMINGPVELVFPLFGPIRERDWAVGWEPMLIYPEATMVEDHMIFRTAATHGDGENYTWVVCQFRPPDYLIEYWVSAADRIWFITIMCESELLQTKATITYTYTGLSPEGNNQNRMALQKMFTHDLKDWEEAINFYLEKGQMLKHSP